jgi:hypothetical protein
MQDYIIILILIRLEILHLDQVWVLVFSIDFSNNIQHSGESVNYEIIPALGNQLQGLIDFANIGFVKLVIE